MARGMSRVIVRVTERSMGRGIVYDIRLLKPR